MPNANVLQYHHHCQYHHHRFLVHFNFNIKMKLKKKVVQIGSSSTQILSLSLSTVEFNLIFLYIHVCCCFGLSVCQDLKFQMFIAKAFKAIASSLVGLQRINLDLDLLIVGCFLGWRRRHTWWQLKKGNF